MGFFSKVERRMEDGFDGIGDKLSNAPITPVQIAKKAEKQMRREKMVGAGKEFAPTLYTVLVNPKDDEALFGYYPTLAGETETYLKAKANEEGLVMDGQPLVRFIVDEELRSGKFDIIAELVSAPIVNQLRQEEMERYGLMPSSAPAAYAAPAPQVGNIPSTSPSSGLDVMAEDAAAESAVPQTTRFEDEAPRPAHAPKPNAILTNLSTGRDFPLVSDRVLLGRGNSCDIIVDDLNVSRTHAELRRESNAVWGIADLGSTNGTLVNGKHIASTLVGNGDRITMGTTTFVLTI